MLVLQRKVGESFMIGETIQISIERVDRGKVRVGIRAPDAVKILRTEIYDRIQAGEKENGS
jgi:carbon storage regulator